MPWLTILHLRAPKATVMLVANKCDGGIDDYSEIAGRVEERTGRLLKEWQDKRGLGDRGGLRLPSLSWVPGRNLVSCKDYGGVSELLKRIPACSSTSIEVPPSWDLALTVVDTLRENGSPFAAVNDHLMLHETPPDTCREWAQTCIPRQELSQEWHRVLSWIEPKLKARARTRALSKKESVHEGEFAPVLSNPESAFNGALWIR